MRSALRARDGDLPPRFLPGPNRGPANRPGGAVYPSTFREGVAKKTDTAQGTRRRARRARKLDVRGMSGMPAGLDRRKLDDTLGSC